MDTGGLAQMTYNNNYSSNGGLAVPNAGFASRSKANHVKRLSVAPPPKINSIYEDERDANPTPRTSRSHLLAGLRTAPKATNMPVSAPYDQTQHQHSFGYEPTARGNSGRGFDMPHTAMASNFGQQSYMSHGQQAYCLPEQVLAPPEINFQRRGSEQMDPQLYEELMATNLYLVQRQQQLQQQLMNVTAAAQQFQGMNLNGNQHSQAMPVMPQNSLYNQQLQNGVQPVIQAVPHQPGLFAVYNPMTGLQTYFIDQTAQQSQLSASPPYSGSSSETDNAGYYRQDTQSPPQQAFATSQQRTLTPPKTSVTPPQEDVTPLPPPSANAFRPGHRKAASTAYAGIKGAGLDGLKSAGLKSSMLPQTPQTGTFGPGMGRAGEHPSRQPRGPPPLEELVAKPTSKHEGSKNFATRQRRRAVHDLVRAGNERRSGRSGNSDIVTPSEEGEMNFSVTSDNDSDDSGHGSLSRRPSFGHLRGTASGAIGSELKQLKERSRDRSLTPHRPAVTSFRSDDGCARQPTFSLFPEDHYVPNERRKTPMLVLTSAEKRKSSIF